MSKKSKKREIIEWSVLIAVAATLYFTGLHTEVIGQVQRIFLATGIITPDTEEASSQPASYNFKLTDFEGNEVPFSEFQEKTVFLNFWATWCPPCIAEMPDIYDLYQKTNKDVTFVMISLDDDQEKAKKFIARKEYDFPVYFLQSSLPSVYNPKSIPTTYVLSPDGNIVLERHGMAKYDTEEFREFLKGL